MVMAMLSGAFGGVMAQELYEDDVPKTEVKAAASASAQVSAVVPQYTPVTKSDDVTLSKRRVSLDLEGLLLRGDFQFAYEISQTKDLSYLLTAHLNPHATFNDITGSFGFGGGARLYIEDIAPGFFTQIVGGFNTKQGDTNLFVEAGAGISYVWQKTISFEVAAVAQRSYHPSDEEPVFYLNTAVSVALDKPFIWW
jgi:hypothetical protein